MLRVRLGGRREEFNHLEHQHTQHTHCIFEVHPCSEPMGEWSIKQYNHWLCTSLKGKKVCGAGWIGLRRSWELMNRERSCYQSTRRTQDTCITYRWLQTKTKISILGGLTRHRWLLNNTKHMDFNKPLNPWQLEWCLWWLWCLTYRMKSDAFVEVCSGLLQHFRVVSTKEDWKDLLKLLKVLYKRLWHSITSHKQDVHKIPR